jgi:hypothetical protein
LKSNNNEPTLVFCTFNGGLMKSFETLASRLFELSPHAVVESSATEESLVGFFQMFRPDGQALQGLYEGLPGETDLGSRLDRLYRAAGDDRRPSGGRDAYFVVRQSPVPTVESATQMCRDWLSAMADLARVTGRDDLLVHLDPIPEIRVLEGIPPKNPKLDVDKSGLFRVLFEEIPKLTSEFLNSRSVQLLRPAYYFIACDPMLRDHLMWPLYREQADLPVDPFASYFDLWCHRVRYRTYRDGHLDLYLPRQLD